MAKKLKYYKFAGKLDDRIGATKRRLFQKHFEKRPLMIQPYRGYGNKDSFNLRGRVLVHKELKEASDQDSLWQNLKAMYKRFNSSEIPNAQLEAIFLGQTQSAKTDKEGYFEIDFPLNTPLPPDQIWHTVDLRLGGNSHTNTTTGKFMIPPASAKLGIISDIDDTVLRTHSSNLLRMAKLTLFNNAHTRLPFKGVAALYRALNKGTENSSFNPMFYVSSSPWNLYDLLEDFFELQNIPMGPFFLRDFGIDETKFITSGHGDHKIVQIEKIMDTYPDMEFILIGDSGEKDPEIFTQVVHDFKDRVRCIYIRNVTKAKRNKAIENLSKEVAAAGTEMLLIKNSEAAAIHAVKSGFIDPATLPDISRETQKDESAPDEMEQLIKGTPPKKSV